MSSMTGRLDQDGFDYLVTELEQAELDLDAVIEKRGKGGRNIEVVRILQGVRSALGSPVRLSSIRTNAYGESDFFQDAAAAALAAEASVALVQENSLFGNERSTALLLKLANYARGLMKGEMD